MIVVPADELALQFGVGLLLDGVVYDQHALFCLLLIGFFLKFAHQRLYQAPQCTGVHLLFCKKAADFVVAYGSLGQS